MLDTANYSGKYTHNVSEYEITHQKYCEFLVLSKLTAVIYFVTNRFAFVAQ